MAEWQEVIGIIDPPVNEDNLRGFEEVLTGLNVVLDEADDIVQVASQILALFESADPITGFILVLQQVLNDLIDNLLKTGVYFFPILPGPAVTEFAQPFPTEKALFRITESLSDRMDSERPQSTAAAGYAAVVFLGGVNKYFDFLSLYRTIQKLLGDQSKWAQIGDVFSNFELLDIKPERGHRKTEGVGWNWHSLRLEELEAVEEALLKAKALINSYLLSLKNSLADIIRIIRKRIAMYLKVLKKIIAFVRFLNDLANLAANLEMVVVYNTEGGVAQMANDIINSAKKPDFQFCSGFALATVFANPASAAGFLKFTEFFGVQEEQWDAAINGR
jgi:hypothetical protein